MCKVEFLGVLEAEKLTKQKWEQYCGTPCNTVPMIFPKIETLHPEFVTR